MFILMKMNDEFCALGAPYHLVLFYSLILKVSISYLTVTSIHDTDKR